MIVISVPHAAVTVIAPLRTLLLVLAMTETDILPLFDPVVGVTVSQGIDSETVQVVFEVMFTV